MLRIRTMSCAVLTYGTFHFLPLQIMIREKDVDPQRLIINNFERWTKRRLKLFRCHGLSMQFESKERQRSLREMIYLGVLRVRHQIMKGQYLILEAKFPRSSGVFE